MEHSSQVREAVVQNSRHENKVVIEIAELNKWYRKVHVLKDIDLKITVGTYIQHFNLFPHLTVLENCALAPVLIRKLPTKEAEENARTLLKRVKIPDRRTNSGAALRWPATACRHRPVTLHESPDHAFR